MRTGRKKRIIRHAVLAFLSAALLLGCAYVREPAEAPETKRPVQRTESAAPASPAPADKPAFSLEDYAVMGQTGLYDLFPALETGGKVLLHAGFTKAGDIRLFFTDSDNGALLIKDLDLKTGLTADVCSMEMENPAGCSVEWTDPPALYDYDTDELILFSSDCAEVVRYPISDRAAEEIRWDGQELLFFDSVAEKLIRTAPGKKETVLFESSYQYEIQSLLSVTEDWTYASVLATDHYTGSSGTLLIDLTDGSAIGWSAGETYLSFSEKRYSALSRLYDGEEDKDRSELIFRTADMLSSNENHEVRYIRDDPFTQIVAVSGGFLAENWDIGYALYHFDASGQNAARIDLPVEQYAREAEALFGEDQEQDPAGEEPETEGQCLVDPIDIYDDWSVFTTPQTNLKSASDGRYALTGFFFGEEIRHLLLWDYGQGETFSDPGMTMNEPLFEPLHTVRTDYGEFASRVERIRKRYGVTVLLGEEADLKIATHTASVAPVEENAEAIGLALDILENALSEYPEGFLEKLSGGEAGGIVVELVGTIRSADSFSLDFPSALTCPLGKMRLLAFDVNYLSEMRYTVFHEISHMIDDCLEEMAMPEDDPFWSEEQWNLLNPEGFSYYDAYNDENGEAYDLIGSEQYTENDPDYLRRKDPGLVYFLNVYSKTFPTEDRAVLMGTLLNDDTQDELLSCPHILEKLKYYFEAIRHYFDPDGTKWTEPAKWEQRIEKLESEEKQNAA